MIVPLLRCPLCHSPLSTKQRSASCEGGHSFDRAREGYLNLLPVQHKHSLTPGDDVAMVGARADFLEAGYYEPLRQALVASLSLLRPNLLLDIGCGEGWYTTALSRMAANTVALDISKHAIKRAAKRDRSITWIVASSADLPLPDTSVDAISATFSPLDTAEASRALKPGGSVFVTAPDADHLLELRAALYPRVRPHQPKKWLAAMALGFQLVTESRVRFRIDLIDNHAVKSLLTMTPYYWRAPRERREQVEALTGLSTQVDCRILQFMRDV